MSYKITLLRSQLYLVAALVVAVGAATVVVLVVVLVVVVVLIMRSKLYEAGIFQAPAND